MQWRKIPAVKAVFAALAVGLAASLPLGDALASSHMPGAGKTVNAGRPDWDTNWFQTEIYIKALEALGYQVERPKTLKNPPLWQAVAQGDLDFETGAWIPLHNTYYNEHKDSVSLVGYVAKGGALQGYLVDKASADKYGVNNLEDFKKADVKEAFDADGDGRADLVACPPGWGCELVIEHHLDAYDLRDHVDPIKADYGPSMADALGRFKNDEPIFFYTWTPNWTVGELQPGKDVVWIEVPFASLPEEQKELEDQTSVPDVQGCVDNPCEMGFPANDIRVVANNDFLAANPAAKRLFEVMTIPLADVFVQNAKMRAGEDDAEDVIRHAEEWIANNKSTFDGWIAEAKKAAM